MRTLLTGIAFVVCVSFVAEPIYALPNRIDYDIRATLDTQRNALLGQEVVTFTNRTGQALGELFFHVYPNAFRRGANTAYQRDLLRAGIDPQRLYANPADDAFLDVTAIRFEGQTLSGELNDTLMRVALPRAVSDSETIRLQIDFIYDLMEATPESVFAAQLAVRSGHRRGVYTIALWYPKVVVYDAGGWQLDPYRLIGEFYGDFANYTVYLTVPGDLVVSGTGAQWAEETGAAGMKTVILRADMARDFAWVASSRFRALPVIMDGIVLRTLYLSQPDLAARALEMLRVFSAQFGAYPYPQLTVAQVEVGGGMEYPGIVMISRGSNQELAHEIAHQWWYGAVGNNEEAEAWLDEAFATYSEELYAIERLGQPYATGRSSVRFREPGLPVLTRASSFPNLLTYFDAVYTKGSGVLWMLRALLGPETFAKVLRTYYDRFKLSNVTTEQFASVAEEVAGQSLGWFFAQWLRTTKTVDFSVVLVYSTRQADGSFQNRATIARMGEATMPVRIALRLSDGTMREERWDGQGSSKEIAFSSTSPLAQVVVDPEQEILEQNRSNNTGAPSSPVGQGVDNVGSLEVSISVVLLVCCRMFSSVSTVLRNRHGL